MLRRILFALICLALLGGFFWLITRDTVAMAPAGPGDSCKGTPEFINKYTFTAAAFDTSRRDKPGLVLIDNADPEKPPVQTGNWRKFGSLGPLVRDDTGAVYTATIPFINTASITKESHLTILRVDPQTGHLDTWLTLQGPPPDSHNYYGITALAYDCATRLLYAAAIAGSSEGSERGFIAAIDVASKRELFRYNNIDALGLGIFGGAKGRHLYLGLARRAEVVRLPLTSQGKPFGQPELVLNFDQFNRTRARDLQFAANRLEVFTTEFYYNLIASTEFTQQRFIYNYHNTSDTFKAAEQ